MLSSPKGDAETGSFYSSREKDSPTVLQVPARSGLRPFPCLRLEKAWSRARLDAGGSALGQPRAAEL